MIGFFVLINFLLFIFLCIYNRKYFENFFKLLNKRVWFFLFFIFAWALVSRLMLPNLHQEIFIDEPWYAEAARNLLSSGMPGEYFKSIAWPFILSIVFKIFGVNNWVAIYTSIFFGSLTVFPLYFFTFLLTKKKLLSFLAPIAFAVLPLHIFWSATSETNVVSIFFIICSWFLAFLYLEKEKISWLWLVLASFSFTAQIRPENYFYIFLFFLFLLIFDWENFQKLKVKYFLPWVLVFLTLPDFIRVMVYKVSTNWVMSDTGVMGSGQNWSFSNLLHNTSSFGFEVFFHQSILVLIFGLIGLVYLFKNKRRHAWFFLILLFGNWLIYFSSWLQTLGGRPRFYLIFYFISSVLAIFGIIYVKKKFFLCKYQRLIFIIFIFLVYVNYLPFLGFPQDERVQGLILETRVPELAQRDIPINCLIVVSEEKTIGATTDFETMRLDDFLNQAKNVLSDNNCVLFYEDWFCLRSDGASQKEKCDKLKEEFDIALYKKYKESGVTYNFYKINNF